MNITNVLSYETRANENKQGGNAVSCCHSCCRNWWHYITIVGYRLEKSSLSPNEISGFCPYPRTTGENFHDKLDGNVLEPLLLSLLPLPYHRCLPLPSQSTIGGVFPSNTGNAIS